MESSIHAWKTRRNTEERRQCSISQMLAKKISSSSRTTLLMPLLLLTWESNVWFHFTINFCLCWGKVQCKLKTSDLEFTIIVGEAAIILECDFMSKNHWGGHSGSGSQTSRSITINLIVIPLYLSQLNLKQNQLFQCACYGSTVLVEEKDVWSMSTPLGTTRSRSLFATSQLLPFWQGSIQTTVCMSPAFST